MLHPFANTILMYGVLCAFSLYRTIKIHSDVGASEGRYGFTVSSISKSIQIFLRSRIRPKKRQENPTKQEAAMFYSAAALEPEWPAAKKAIPGQTSSPFNLRQRSRPPKCYFPHLSSNTLAL